MILMEKASTQQRLYLRDFNQAMFCSMALLFVSAFNYGFSDQSFASTQATTAFTKQFGDFNPKTKKYALSALYLSLLNSLKAGTQLIGVFIGSWASNRYGRRWCIFLMSIYALGSTSVLVSGLNRPQMLAGRSIHYIYLGMQLAVIPTFLAEISPVQMRGGTGVLYWLAIKCGGLVVTGITRATSNIPDNGAWQIPMGLIFIIPAIVLTLVWFIPESPRWLLLGGRPDDALLALTRLRRSRAEKRAKATPSAAIMAEFKDLSAAIQKLREEAPQCSESGRIVGLQDRKRFLAIFSPKHLRRTIIVVLLLFFQQSTGQSFASQYGTLFVKALGTVNPFSVALGINAIDISGIILCMTLADRVGRRPLLITSALVQTIALLIMGGLGTAAHTADTSSAATTASTGYKAGIVAMLLLFSFGWSFGYAPLAYVVAAELPSPCLREYSLRTAYTVKLVMEFVVSFTYPYLEDPDKANLGGRLGFIYGAVSLLAFVFSVFCVPETRNVELEDMDAKFGGGGVLEAGIGSEHSSSVRETRPAGHAHGSIANVMNPDS